MKAILQLVVFFSIIYFVYKQHNNQINQCEPISQVEINPNKIDLVVQEKYEKSTSKLKQLKSIINYKSLDALSNSEPINIDTIVPKKQFKDPIVYNILSSGDTTLIGIEGTSLSFKGNSFLIERTGLEVSGNIKIELQEYYTMADIINAGLSTKSGDSLLETGGMVHVLAKSGNENCILKPGSTFKIGFDTTYTRGDMKLYSGVTISSSEIDWQLSDTPERLPDSLAIIIENDSSDLLAFYHSLSVNIKYPPLAREYSREGICFISFIVNKQGDMKDIKVLRGFDDECDREALRVVKNFKGKFKPVKKNGIAVDFKMTIPIIFRLDDKSLNLEEDFKQNVFKKDTLKNLNANIISQYFFNSSKLGWLNCDRMIEIKKPKIDFIATIDDVNDISGNLILKSYRSIINGIPINKGFKFKNLPIDEPISIALIRYDNELPSLAIKESNSNALKEKDFVFEELTLENYKEMLKHLEPGK